MVLTVSQPLPHLRLSLFFIGETFATFLDPAVNRFTRKSLPTINRKIFLWISFALSHVAHKNAESNTALR
jgi:hypothetical protein